ncbi:sugar ABC transporter permease [Paenibacillus alginolyticus]|uniref:carbohydrate ABC transporter permease n=1 Tax=Paenibacillus alginolyticus TaxID=59839 RepID=UPI0004047F3A|nr:sugar ABC transporter permease [Paenibacillus alginolyticus]MCY9665372.1 sugar ABC transporter permease [Paenibacillus alginolyticus]
MQKIEASIDYHSIGRSYQRKRGKYKEYLWAYLFISAPILGFLLFAFIPLSFSVYVSFTQYSGYQTPVFQGADNYSRLLTKDPLFWKTLFNTFYSALGIQIGMVIALGIAMSLNQKIRGIQFFRTVFFLPTISSVVALTLLWKWMFNSEYGMLNYLLDLIGIHGPAWLSSERWAMPAMIIQGVWGGLGFYMVLYLVALQGVPKSLYESAEMDGANGWQRFLRITIPCISPTTLFILITSIIGAMQDFPRFQIMTEGGPNYSTTTIVYYLFQNAFRYMEMGYASAMAWVLGILIMMITLLNFWMSKRWVHYE